MTALLRRLLTSRFAGRTPPTVPGAGRVVFHCRTCRTVLADDVRTCPSCGTAV